MHPADHTRLRDAIQDAVTAAYHAGRAAGRRAPDVKDGNHRAAIRRSSIYDVVQKLLVEAEMEAEAKVRRQVAQALLAVDGAAPDGDAQATGWRRAIHEVRLRLVLPAALDP